MEEQEYEKQDKNKTNGKMVALYLPMPKNYIKYKQTKNFN